jgi:hypothetical protein
MTGFQGEERTKLHFEEKTYCEESWSQGKFKFE